MKLTRIDLNSWILEAASCRILIDPWLVGPLVFYGQSWLFEATRRTPAPFTVETLPPLDGILLSQGLDDHSHRPTLERLNRALPVFASPAAARVARALGFRQVEALAPWEHTRLGNLVIQATPGADVGQPENGYLLTDLDTESVLYYEPHLSAPTTLARLAQQSRVDALLIPVVGQAFPLMGEVLMGPEKALAVCRALTPQTVVPTALADLDFKGVLPPLIRTVGSLDEFDTLLAQAGLTARLCRPAPGQSVALTASRR